jgi:hypothetical protein
MDLSQVCMLAGPGMHGHSHMPCPTGYSAILHRHSPFEFR